MKWPAPPRFEPYSLVYLRANAEMCGSVTGYIVRQGCPVQYLITWGIDVGEQAHWEGELTAERVFGTGGENEG
jgi:hypothetical protein